MRVSVMQMNPGANKSENIAQARHLIEQAVEHDRPNIVSLPEVWDSLGGDRATRTANAEHLPARGSNEPGGEAYEFLRETARATKTFVHGGSIIEQGPEKLFNTTVVFDPDGTELARYRKMLRGLHLLRTRYLEPAPGLLAQTLAALEEVGEREADALLFMMEGLPASLAIGLRRGQ